MSGELVAGYFNAVKQNENLIRRFVDRLFSAFSDPGLGVSDFDKLIAFMSNKR